MTINNILKTIDNKRNPEFQIWCHILKHAPTKTWEQPILTFIDNIKEKLPNGKIKISNKNITRCLCFIRNIARIIYAKSLADEPKNGLTIRQEMRNATEYAKQNKIYKPTYKVFKHFRLSKEFEQKLKGDIPKQLQWGLCAIVEFSNNIDIYMKKDHLRKFKSKLTAKSAILQNAVVGQFFPNKWSPDFPNSINKWNNERIKKTLQTIGNLMLVENDIYKNTHKIWKDNFFTQCKDPKIGRNYKNSIFGEIVLYCAIPDNIEWIYGFWKDRQKQSVNLLIDFFSCIGEEKLN